MRYVTVAALCALFFMSGIAYGVHSEFNKANEYILWGCQEKDAMLHPNLSAMNLSGWSFDYTRVREEKKYGK